MQNVSTQHQPQSTQELALILDPAALTTLIENRGGTRVFIPKRMNTQHRLADLLGIDQARKLSSHFGGETLGIARGVAAKRAVRNQIIIQRYGEGERVPDLAMEFGLTERMVYTILNGY